MLTTIFLSLALTAGVHSQSAQPAEARIQAEQLARSGSHAAALEKFQAIAAANPDDVEARVWIARLHVWIGNPNRAVPVYESIIASDRQHLEALIGLGTSLTAVGRLREASDALNRAESLAPNSGAVLAAQGQLHAKSGRSALALAYYQRALALEPASVAIRRESDALRAQRAHRVVFGYLFEHFNTDVADPQAGFGTFDARASDSLRVSATVQHQRKFSLDETRGGAGIEWMARHNLRVHAGALVGGDTQIFPEVDANGGVAFTLGRATWAFDVRVADFDQIDVYVAGGGGRFALSQRSAMWVNYYRFDTDYQFARSDIVHSWVLGGSGRITPEWTLGGEYTRGPDQLHFLTLDKTGTFEANTVSAFADVQITPMLSVDGRYDYQARPSPGDDLRVHRATLRLIQRF